MAVIQSHNRNVPSIKPMAIFDPSCEKVALNPELSPLFTSGFGIDSSVDFTGARVDAFHTLMWFSRECARETTVDASGENKALWLVLAFKAIMRTSLAPATFGVLMVAYSFLMILF